MMPLSESNDAAMNRLDASIEGLCRHRYPRDMRRLITMDTTHMQSDMLRR